VTAGDRIAKATDSARAAAAFGHLAEHRRRELAEERPLLGGEAAQGLI
jgi:hypothetical protein